MAAYNPGYIGSHKLGLEDYVEIGGRVYRGMPEAVPGSSPQPSQRQATTRAAVPVKAPQVSLPAQSQPAQTAKVVGPQLPHDYLGSAPTEPITDIAELIQIAEKHGKEGTKDNLATYFQIGDYNWEKGRQAAVIKNELEMEKEAQQWRADQANNLLNAYVNDRTGQRNFLSQLKGFHE